MKTSLVAAFVLVASTLAACSSGTENTASSSASVSTSGTASFCASYCDHWSACDSSIDKDTCSTECEDAASSTFRRLRSDIVEPTKTCFMSSDCKSILSGNALSDCVEEAAVSVAPSAAAKSFCDAFAGAAGRCDASIDRADCLNAAKIYGDETLEAAKACTEKSCSQMGTCIKAELGE